MYFLDALQYPFKSEHTIRRVLTACLLLFIPIVNILGFVVLAGYTIKLVRSLLTGDINKPKALPAFAFVEDFKVGLWVVLATIVLAIPLALMVLVILSAYPVSYDLEANPTMNPFAQFLIFSIQILYTPLIIIPLSRYALEGRFGVLFEVGRNVNYVFNHPTETLLYYANAVAFNFILGIAMFVGLLLFVLPGVLLLVLSIFMQPYLYARYAREVGVNRKQAVVA